jgi:hypothetical protein
LPPVDKTINFKRLSFFKGSKFYYKKMPRGAAQGLV